MSSDTILAEDENWDTETLSFMERRMVVLDYTNYRGERRQYIVVPIKLWFAKTEYHPCAQWLLMAHVPGKGRRDFALKDVHSWSIYDPEGLL